MSTDPVASSPSMSHEGLNPSHENKNSSPPLNSVTTSLNNSQCLTRIMTDRNSMTVATSCSSQ